MTRWLLFAVCTVICVLDVIRKGYPWHRAVVWTWQSQRAQWRFIDDWRETQ